jgi:hypothetical protein
VFLWHSIAIPQLTILKADFLLCRSYFTRCATKLDNLSHCGHITVAWIKAKPCHPFPATAFIHFDFTLVSLTII